MASTNGGLKVATGLLTVMVALLGGALLASTTHISRTDAQKMVDRGDNTIKERLDRIDKKLDEIDKLIRQGQSP